MKITNIFKYPIILSYNRYTSVIGRPFRRIVITVQGRKHNIDYLLSNISELQILNLSNLTHVMCNLLVCDCLRLSSYVDCLTSLNLLADYALNIDSYLEKYLKK